MTSLTSQSLAKSNPLPVKPIPIASQFRVLIISASCWIIALGWLPAQTLREAAANFPGLRVGAAIKASSLGGQAYANTLRHQFNLPTPENDTKWGPLRPSQNTFAWSAADANANFARAVGQQIRGHTMLWYKSNPTWLTGGGFTTTEARDILFDHIDTVAAHYQGDVYCWDAVNEAFNDNGTLRDSFWYNSPGIGYAANGTRYIEETFIRTATADPQALLFYNDYGAALLFDETYQRKPAYWAVWNALANQAEKLTVLDFSNGDSTNTFSQETLSAGTGRQLAADGVSDFITLALAVPAAGPWNVKLGYRQSGASGKFQLAIAPEGSSNFTNVGGVVDAKRGAGTLALTAANDYTTPTVISGGILVAYTLAAAGSPSGIGAASDVSANLVINGGTLRHEAANVATTNRKFALGLAGGTLDSSATAITDIVHFSTPLAMGFNSQLSARTLTLAGSNPGNNLLNMDLNDDSAGNPTSIVKQGSGKWQITGTSNEYTADPSRTAFMATATDYTVTYAGRSLWKTKPVEGKSTDSKMAFRHEDKAVVVYYDGSSGLISASDIARFDGNGGAAHPFWKAKL